MKMRSFICTLTGALIALSSCGHSNGSRTAAGGSSPATDSTRVLVAYFSATGTTRKAAADLAQAMGGTLYEITPEQAYTDADLDWRDSTSRSSVEMRNRTYRPAIRRIDPHMADYDIVFVGYPNWWNTAPTIINTFIETYNLSGKTVIPFMTSGGGGIENSENDLHTAYPTLNWGTGKLLNEYSAESLGAWKEELGL